MNIAVQVQQSVRSNSRSTSIGLAPSRKVPDSRKTASFFHSVRKSVAENMDEPSSQTEREKELSLVAALKIKGKLREARTKVSSKRLVVLPTNGLKMKWDMLIGLLIVYSVLTIPFNIGFDLSYEFPHPSFIFDCVIDILFLADMILAFNTAIIDSRTQEVILDRGKIVKNYLQSWFTIDFLSTVPIDLIAKQLMGGGGGGSIRSIKLIRVLRLVRLLKLVRLFKLSKLAQLLDFDFISPAAMKLLKLMAIITFMAHLLACFWHLICTMTPEEPKNWNNRHGYMSEIDCTREQEHGLEHCVEGQTGFVQILVPISKSGTGDKYLASFYWVFASMMAVGYGDIFAVTDSERLYSIITQIIGACCFGFIIANVTILIESMDPQGKAYKAHTSRFSEYISERDLPRALGKKLKKHLEHYLQSTSVFDGDRILDELPVELKTKLTNSIYADLVERLEIMKNCEDASIVADIMQQLLPMTASPHTQFYSEGDVPLDMYFVGKGKVHAFIMLPITARQKHQKELEIKHDIEVSEHKHDVEMHQKHTLQSHLHMPHLPAHHKSDEDDEEIAPTDPHDVSLERQEVAIGVIEAGHSFGESELLHNCNRQYSVHSSQHSDLYVLTKAKFEELLFVHSEVARDITAQSNKHQIAFSKVLESETMERVAEDGFHRYSVKTLMMVNGQLRRQEKINNRLFRRASIAVQALNSAAKKDGGAKKNGSKKAAEVPDRSASQTDLTGALDNTKNKGKQASVCILCLRSRTAVMREVQQELHKGHVHPAMGAPQSPTLGGSNPASPSAMVPGTQVPQDTTTTKSDTPSPSSAHAQQYAAGEPATEPESSSSSDSDSRVGATRPPPVNMPAPVSVPKSGSKRLSLNFGRPPHPNGAADKASSPAPHQSSMMDLVGNDRGALSCVGKDDEDAHKYIVMEESTSTMVQRWIINPDDMRKIKWDLVLGVMILYSVMIIPFRLSFGVESTGGYYILDWTIDCFFFLDICASFRTAYWHSYDSEVLVCVPSAISAKYLKSWFTVDFLSTVPIDVIFEAILSGSASASTADTESGDGDGGLRSLKLIRVLRLVRLLKLVRLMKLGKNMGHLEEFMDVGDGVIKLGKLVGQLFFLAHLFGCFWFFITGDKKENLASQDSTQPWWKATSVGESTESQYIASLYWAFTTMTTVGYGDIVPTTNGERIYATLIMILGATVFGYIVGNVAGLVTAENATNKRESVWSTTTQWIEEQNIAISQKSRIKQHYEWLWQTHSVFDEKQIFSVLPTVLKNEVINQIHHEFLVKIAIFKQPRFRNDEGFTAYILSCMRPEFCPAGEYIIVPGRTAKCMHFLLQGIAELFEDDLDGEVVKEVLEVGSFFGHEALLSHSKHSLGVRAFSACRTYSLSKLDIGELVESHPAIASKLQDALAVSIKMQHHRLQRKHLVRSVPGAVKATTAKSSSNSAPQGADRALEEVLEDVGLMTDKFLPGNVRHGILKGQHSKMEVSSSGKQNGVVVKRIEPVRVKESASVPTLPVSTPGPSSDDSLVEENMVEC